MGRLEKLLFICFIVAYFMAVGSSIVRHYLGYLHNERDKKENVNIRNSVR
jgi:hypothetical protein